MAFAAPSRRHIIQRVVVLLFLASFHAEDETSL